VGVGDGVGVGLIGTRVGSTNTGVGTAVGAGVGVGVGVLSGGSRRLRVRATGAATTAAGMRIAAVRAGAGEAGGVGGVPESPFASAYAPPNAAAAAMRTSSARAIERLPQRTV
jgi:hypothetical protein